MAKPDSATSINQGDPVRLLLPIWDGKRRVEAGVTILWPFTDPPLVRTAILASAPTGGHNERP